MRSSGLEPPRTIRSTRPSTLSTGERYVRPRPDRPFCADSGTYGRYRTTDDRSGSSPVASRFAIAQMLGRLGRTDSACAPPASLERGALDRQRSSGHAARWWGDGLHSARVERRAAGRRPVGCEHACDERAGMCGAGGYEPGPSFAPELLTNLLIGRPCASARSWGLE